MSIDKSLLLSDLHPHAKDGTIELDILTHTYAVHGVDHPLISVTSLVGRYLPYPDLNAIIDANFAKWQDSIRYPSLAGLSVQAIRLKMSVESKIAAEMGSTLHKKIEMFFNGQEIDSYMSEEWSQFTLFQERYKIIPYRTEMKIYSLRSSVGGTIDLLVRNGDGSMTIYDWKRTKHPLISWNSKRRGYGPLCKLYDNAFERYAIQLNVYRAILEECYNCEIKSMFLVRFHPDISNYEVQQVRRMNEAEKLLDAIDCMVDL